MCLIFALILAVAGAAHQHVLGYEFDVRSTFGDYLPLVALVSLIALQLSLSVRDQAGPLEAGLASFPIVACAVAVATGTVGGEFSLGIEMLWYPSVLLALTGAAILWEGVRRSAPTLTAISGAYLIGAILTAGFSPARPYSLNWYLSGFVLAMGLLAVGLLRRSIALCLLGVLVATAGTAVAEDFHEVAVLLGLSRVGAIVGMAGLGALLVALVFGRAMPPALVAVGAMGTVGSVLDLGPAGLGFADLAMATALMSLSAALWLRVRHWPPSAVLCIPVGQRLWLAFIRLAAWKYVALSFVFLFTGAVLSSLKGSRLRSDGVTPGTPRVGG